MGQEPSKPGPPGTKFRVIGAGMSRTGTKTLNEALRILLDGPVHDSGVQSLGGSFGQIRRWLQIMALAPRAHTVADRKRLEYWIADVLEGYVATMDCPAAALTPELLAVFPDALVVATTRDPDAWWRSMRCMQTMLSNRWLPLLLLWVPKQQWFGRWRHEFGRLTRWRYGQDMFTPDTLRIHEDHLRAVVPPERLHWYHVSDGWAPLCKMLDLPVPDRPFPHNNSQNDARKVYHSAIVAGIVMWCVVITLTWAAVWVVKGW